MSPTSFWGSKARQFRAHARARVSDAERVALLAWVSPEQLVLFDEMHVADQRHGLGNHADESARLAGVAGCSVLTIALIRHQDEPRDGDAGERLQLADEAN